MHQWVESDGLARGRPAEGRGGQQNMLFSGSQWQRGGRRASRRTRETLPRSVETVSRSQESFSRKGE